MIAGYPLLEGAVPQESQTEIIDLATDQEITTLLSSLPNQYSSNATLLFLRRIIPVVY
jgi:hypothetical protein